MADPQSRARPKVALLIPTARRPEVLTPEALDRLGQIAEVRTIEGDGAALREALPALLGDADAALTGWGTPPLTDEAIAAAPRLQLIAHTAGSVKRLVPPSALEREIVVCHAANVIADAVADFAILAMLVGLRQVQVMDRRLKEGAHWRDAAEGIVPRQLGARVVGLVGAGYVGRKVVRLLRAFGSRVLVYDPYLSAADADGLQVESVPLDELFRRSEVVSVHAPITPETHHLVGAGQLALLRDGAIFVNCARSWVVDPDALLQTLQTGRIWAALDVFDQEPLPADSPFRALPNVLLTPHQAGHTLDTHQRQGREMVDEIDRYFRGEPLRYRIRPEVFALMA